MTSGRGQVGTGCGPVRDGDGGGRSLIPPLGLPRETCGLERVPRTQPPFSANGASRRLVEKMSPPSLS